MDTLSSPKNRLQYLEIDGVDGVGKTTQAGLFQESLFKRHIDAEILKEVSGYDKISGELRNTLLNNEFGDITEMFLFLALKSNCFHKKILDALQQGKIVISDRGNASFLTYNDHYLQDKDMGRQLLRLITKGIEPDATVIIDLPEEELIHRLEKKGSKSKFDSMDLKKLIHQDQLLKQMANDIGDRFVVDGLGSKEEVQERIQSVIFKNFII